MGIETLCNVYSCQWDVFRKKTSHVKQILLPWVSYCYNGDAPYLWTGEHFLRSVTDVQQGDPLRPLVFAVALQPLALQLKKLVESVPGNESTNPTLLSAWHLDDGYIIARHEKLRLALEILRSDVMRSRGFHLNPSKCELWWPESPSEDVRSSYRDVLTQPYTDGTLVLNASGGSKEFCEASFTAKVRSLEPLLDDVAALEISHVSFTLLKFCCGVCKINYLLRVAPADSTASGAVVFDNLLEKCMRRILGGTLDYEVFKELQLPMKTDPEHPHLGIGLTSACDTAASAFISSAAGCNKLVEMALMGSAVKGHSVVGTRTLIRRYAPSQVPLRHEVCPHFPALGASCSSATRLYL